MADALVSAAQDGNLARVRELLESDRASANAALLAAVNLGFVEVAHLPPACRTAKVSIVELLLQRGVDPNAKGILSTVYFCDQPGPIFAALVNGGIDPNTQDVIGGMNSTILTELCRLGDLKSATTLLDRGADPNAKGEKTPLSRAMESRNQVLVDLLLERGARARSSSRSHPRSPTPSTSRSGRHEPGPMTPGRD